MAGWVKKEIAGLKPQGPETEEEEEALEEMRKKRRKGTDVEELEGRVVRSPGGADFVARIRGI